MKKIFLILMIFLSIIFSYAYAQEFQNLNAEELKMMIDKKTKMVIADVRTEEEYRQGHLPTAINIPPDKYISISSYLPKNKKTLLIFYCRGYG